MILVDSSVWIDLFRNGTHPATDYLAREIEEAPFVVGDLILAEVLRGCRSDADAQRIEDRLDALPQAIVGDRAIAIAAARNFRTLRAIGITVRGTIDCLIATRCIAEGWLLLYSDRDFDPFVAHLGLRSALAEAT